MATEANICPVCKEISFYQTSCVAFEDTHLHRLGMEERSTWICTKCGASYLRKVKPDFIRIRDAEAPIWLKRKLDKKK